MFIRVIRILSLLCLLTLMGREAAVAATTTRGGFVAEEEMKDSLMQMLARFATYMKADFQDCREPNAEGEACGCFRGEHTMANDERGVRPNADLSMICAFLAKYGKGKAMLPDGVTWDDIERMAMQSLVFAYSTHKATRLKVCAGGNYWGSTSKDDAVWESSLWAMSVAYSAFFQWHRLTGKQKYYIHMLLKAECQYELERTIPTGYAGDTKAEENGWEADVLAAALGLFPNDPEAPRWFQRLREFAINSYSHPSDAADHTVIDPHYDQTTVADLYRGQNLYDDYTLQNHNYFHTSYQNVVIQELGEAALALKLFQTDLRGEEQWKTNALMHNNDRVMQEVLYWLALADGELAMPNGNDWSLFLYDQITSYTTNACFLRDPHALMLENRAYQMIRHRQQTTTDGAWLLRPDVGARRMGVQAHRVMMTWLMHHVLPTADMEATPWADFCREFSRAKVLTSQNIVRAATPHRFTCFSWSTGLKSYTGYISPLAPQLTPAKTNLIVPFRANNTGNFLGWYEVKDRKTNATPVVSGIYDLQDNAYVMNGELSCNDGALNHRFALYSTPGNAVVYIDYVRTNEPCTITCEKGGLTAISVDETTSLQRTLASSDGEHRLDGSTFATLSGPWVCIDGDLGIVTTSPHIAFGERTQVNSVMTAPLYASYSDQTRTLQQGEVAGSRAIVYYTHVDARQTALLSSLLMPLSAPEGWKGIVAFDSDGRSPAYLLLSNFAGRQHRPTGISTALGAPVFTVATTIDKGGSTAALTVEENHSVAQPLHFLVRGDGIEAVQAQGDPGTISMRNLRKGKNDITVVAFDGTKRIEQRMTLHKKPVRLTLKDGKLKKLN